MTSIQEFIKLLEKSITALSSANELISKYKTNSQTESEALGEQKQLNQNLMSQLRKIINSPAVMALSDALEANNSMAVKHAIQAGALQSIGSYLNELKESLYAFQDHRNTQLLSLISMPENLRLRQCLYTVETWLETSVPLLEDAALNDTDHYTLYHTLSKEFAEFNLKHSIHTQAQERIIDNFQLRFLLSDPSTTEELVKLLHRRLENDAAHLRLRLSPLEKGGERGLGFQVSTRDDRHIASVHLSNDMQTLVVSNRDFHNADMASKARIKDIVLIQELTDVINSYSNEKPIVEIDFSTALDSLSHTNTYLTQTSEEPQVHIKHQIIETAKQRILDYVSENTISNEVDIRELFDEKIQMTPLHLNQLAQDPLGQDTSNYELEDREQASAALDIVSTNLASLRQKRQVSLFKDQVQDIEDALLKKLPGALTVDVKMHELVMKACLDELQQAHMSTEPPPAIFDLDDKLVEENLFKLYLEKKQRLQLSPNTKSNAEITKSGDSKEQDLTFTQMVQSMGIEHESIPSLSMSLDGEKTELRQLAQMIKSGNISDLKSRGIRFDCVDPSLAERATSFWTHTERFSVNYYGQYIGELRLNDSQIVLETSSLHYRDLQLVQSLTKGLASSLKMKVSNYKLSSSGLQEHYKQFENGLTLLHQSLKEVYQKISNLNELILKETDDNIRLYKKIDLQRATEDKDWIERKIRHIEDQDKVLGVFLGPLKPIELKARTIPKNPEPELPHGTWSGDLNLHPWREDTATLGVRSLYRSTQLAKNIYDSLSRINTQFKPMPISIGQRFINFFKKLVGIESFTLSNQNNERIVIERRGAELTVRTDELSWSEHNRQSTYERLDKYTNIAAGKPEHLIKSTLLGTKEINRLHRMFYQARWDDETIIRENALQKTRGWPTIASKQQLTSNSMEVQLIQTQVLKADRFSFELARKFPNLQGQTHPTEIFKSTLSSNIENNPTNADRPWMKNYIRWNSQFNKKNHTKETYQETQPVADANRSKKLNAVKPYLGAQTSGRTK